MKIYEPDRVTVRRLCHTLDMPRHQVIPLLSQAGVPVEIAPDTGEVVASRSALGAFRRAVGA